VAKNVKSTAIHTHLNGNVMYWKQQKITESWYYSAERWHLVIIMQKEYHLFLVFAVLNMTHHVAMNFYTVFRFIVVKATSCFSSVLQYSLCVGNVTVLKTIITIGEVMCTGMTTWSSLTSQVTRRDLITRWTLTSGHSQKSSHLVLDSISSSTLTAAITSGVTSFGYHLITIFTKL